MKGWVDAGDPAYAEAVARMTELRKRTRGLLWRIRSHWERRGYSYRSWRSMGLPLYLYRLRRLFRDCRRALAVFGAEVREEHGISRLTQLRRMMGNFLRWRLDPAEYYYFRLYEPDRAHLAPLFISDPENGEVLVAAIGSRDPQRTKREFWERCRKVGLPAIPILAECSASGGEPILHDPESSAWNGDLFSKPDSSGEGRGARMWIREEGGGWRDGDSRVRTREELLALVASSEEHEDWIVQPRAETHSAISDLTTGALCTVRIVSYRDPTSGAVEFLFAALKLPCGGVGDNISLGGVAAPVFLDSGRLGGGRPRDVPGQKTPVLERHPVTDAPIVDRVVPHWEELKALARKVHSEAFPENATGGWDIAVTDDGPVLVEANDIWGGCPLVQTAYDVPIGLTSYPQVMLKFLRAAEARRALERRF